MPETANEAGRSFLSGRFRRDVDSVGGRGDCVGDKSKMYNLKQKKNFFFFFSQSQFNLIKINEGDVKH